MSEQLLCSRFFLTEEASQVHAQSSMHFNAFIKILNDKIAENEEKKRKTVDEDISIDAETESMYDIESMPIIFSKDNVILESMPAVSAEASILQKEEEIVPHACKTI
ncbi:hypothetical protein CBL_20418 [Carabus blaptoides fortunei]